MCPHMPRLGYASGRIYLYHWCIQMMHRGCRIAKLIIVNQSLLFFSATNYHSMGSNCFAQSSLHLRTIVLHHVFSYKRIIVPQICSLWKILGYSKLPLETYLNISCYHWQLSASIIFHSEHHPCISSCHQYMLFNLLQTVSLLFASVLLYEWLTLVFYSQE